MSAGLALRLGMLSNLALIATLSSGLWRRNGNGCMGTGRTSVCVWSPLYGAVVLIGVDLDMLATHPDYRRRGAGSMLIQWGCDVADREGSGAYIDASKAGAPLYAKHGFVDHNNPADKSEIASMMRN